jgi:hypothetical protein
MIYEVVVVLGDLDFPRRLHRLLRNSGMSRPFWERKEEN